MKEEENNTSKKINTKKVNQLLGLGNKIAKILYVLFIILLIYVVTLILREWKILSFIGKILSLISPLFVGWFIAWLLHPIVNKLVSRNMKKGLAVALTYLMLFVVVVLILGFTLPSLGEQISDLVSAIPQIVSDVGKGIDDLFVKLSNLSLQNLDDVKSAFLLKINSIASEIQTKLPDVAVNVISTLAGGIGKIAISIVLSFYISYDFDKLSGKFINCFPKKHREGLKDLLHRLNNSLYAFISGTLWLSLLLFVVSVIGFSIIGLNAPILVSFICVVTNLIPYIGPYIGAAIAGMIGFAESPLIGFLTLVFILIVQIIEGQILHPLVMSKKMDLSPITIIISLIIFEYLFGIFGMIIATPVVALLKIIYEFLDERYNFFGFIDKEEEEVK